MRKKLLVIGITTLGMVSLFATVACTQLDTADKPVNGSTTPASSTKVADSVKVLTAFNTANTTIKGSMTTSEFKARLIEKSGLDNKLSVKEFAEQYLTLPTITADVKWKGFANTSDDSYSLVLGLSALGETDRDVTLTFKYVNKNELVNHSLVETAVNIVTDLTNANLSLDYVGTQDEFMIYFNGLDNASRWEWLTSHNSQLGKIIATTVVLKVSEDDKEPRLKIQINLSAPNEEDTSVDFKFTIKQVEAEVTNYVETVYNAMSEATKAIGTLKDTKEFTDYLNTFKTLSNSERLAVVLNVLKLTKDTHVTYDVQVSSQGSTLKIEVTLSATNEESKTISFLLPYEKSGSSENESGGEKVKKTDYHFSTSVAPTNDDFSPVRNNPDSTSSNTLQYDQRRYMSSSYNNGYVSPTSKEIRKTETARNRLQFSGQEYTDLLQNSYHIYITNFQYKNETQAGHSDVNSAGGTAWILDYQKTTDGSYPRTWYFATNLHVARHLYNPNSYGAYATDKSEAITTQFAMSQGINNGGTVSGTQLAEASKGNFYTFNESQGNIHKLVYLGLDYLKTSPQDYNGAWPAQELLDFAVFEVTYDSAEQAQKATQNYAWRNSNQFSVSDSLVQNKSAIEENNLYVVGFPSTGAHNFEIKINKADIHDLYKDDFSYLKERPDLTWGSSAWWDYVSQGNNLASSPFYSGDHNNYGISDALINLANFHVPYRDKTYKLQGLQYALESGAMGGGSSGSQVKYGDDTLAILYAQWDGNDVGIALGLRNNQAYTWDKASNYTTPSYDIVYGNHLVKNPLQKNSYFDAIKKISNGKFNTNLFSDWSEKE